MIIALGEALFSWECRLLSAACPVLVGDRPVPTPERPVGSEMGSCYTVHKLLKGSPCFFTFLSGVPVYAAALSWSPTELTPFAPSSPVANNTPWSREFHPSVQLPGSPDHLHSEQQISGDYSAIITVVLSNVIFQVLLLCGSLLPLCMAHFFWVLLLLINSSEF